MKVDSTASQSGQGRKYWTRLPEGTRVESFTKSFYGDWNYSGLVWNPIVPDEEFKKAIEAFRATYKYSSEQAKEPI